MSANYKRKGTMVVSIEGANVSGKREWGFVRGKLGDCERVVERMRWWLVGGGCARLPVKEGWGAKDGVVTGGERDRMVAGRRKTVWWLRKKG
ncbi:hypothetical protein ACH5RR_029148 [Cinchona calisaya]|uniref:Uncharacterized protein n=1 Tax=Cinchona calisaya TaxID=153742 RepID=A0ABD2YV94_9GENT